ncbi:MAG TPA: hypothetical protein VNV39_14145 [Stellaceae bacterium]|nr:hypothetical protein [Stellaceae bacterium]
MAKLRHIAIAAKDPDAMAISMSRRSTSRSSARTTGRSPMAII